MQDNKKTTFDITSLFKWQRETGGKKETTTTTK